MPASCATASRACGRSRRSRRPWPLPERRCCATTRAPWAAAGGVGAVARARRVELAPSALPWPCIATGRFRTSAGDHPEHQGIAVARVAVAMRFLAGVAEAVALAELEMAVADPEFEDSAEDVAGFLALMAVALLAVGARRETRVEDLQLAAGLRGEQFVDDAVFVMHAHARVAPHHVAGVRRVHCGLAGEEPLDGHAEAAGDVEQRRNRRIRQVAFQLADVAGGEFALCGQLGQGQPRRLRRPRMRVPRKCVSLRGVSVASGGDGRGMRRGPGCVCGILGAGPGPVEGAAARRSDAPGGLEPFVDRLLGGAGASRRSATPPPGRAGCRPGGPPAGGLA